MIRLQKFIADAGIASRRKAEILIESGKIKVNDVVITKLGTTVDPEHDHITYNDRPIKPISKHVYIALHKPEGYVSSTVSNQGRSVNQLVELKPKVRLYPVGRLDKDSSGLMIMTNDGDFAQRVTHAKFGLSKEYFVVLDQDLRAEDIVKLKKGLRLNGEKIAPVDVVNAANKSARLILHQGINRQIRRMLGALGYTVVRLKRVRIGKLEIGKMQPGNWSHIKPKDVL